MKNFKYHAFFRVISKYLLFIFGVYYSHISTSGIAGTLKDVDFCVSVLNIINIVNVLIISKIKGL